MNAAGPPLLQAKQVTKRFGDRVLWSGLDVVVDAGEILALRGPSGSGKSTLLHCLGLLERPDEGVVLHGGEDLRSRRWGMRRRRAELVGFLFQDYLLVEDATVHQNLDIAARPSVFSPRSDYEATLDRFGLGGRSRDRVHVLSGGERQRLALARLCVRPTGVVLADEPTAALDGANAETVLQTLREFAGAGRAVVVATHSAEVAAIADRVLWLGDTPHWETARTGEAPPRPTG